MNGSVIIKQTFFLNKQLNVENSVELTIFISQWGILDEEVPAGMIHLMGNVTEKHIRFSASLESLHEKAGRRLKAFQGRKIVPRSASTVYLLSLKQRCYDISDILYSLLQPQTVSYAHKCS